jgi:serine/threonine protein kinase
MADVYQARDTRLNRDVAVKCLKGHLAENEEFRERFRREAEVMAGLDHPNIVNVQDVGEYEDEATAIVVPYIVMEIVKGSTLGDFLLAEGKLPQTKALQITGQVLAALDCAHDHGVVHRDIKPSNVMVTKSGQIKVMDFGIARILNSQTLTASDTVVGTPLYLAPEYLEGKPFDKRTDLYAVGCLLYELLTGRPPFGGDTPVQVAMQHIQSTHQPPSALEPSVTASVDEICRLALAKDPDLRYQSAQAMQAAIAEVIKETPRGTWLGYERLKRTPSQTSLKIIPRPKSRSLVTVLVMISLVVLLVGVGAIATQLALEDHTPPTIVETVTVSISTLPTELTTTPFGTNTATSTQGSATPTAQNQPTNRPTTQTTARQTTASTTTRPPTTATPTTRPPTTTAAPNPTTTTPKPTTTAPLPTPTPTPTTPTIGPPRFQSMSLSANGRPLTTVESVPVGTTLSLSYQLTPGATVKEIKWFNGTLLLKANGATVTGHSFTPTSEHIGADICVKFILSAPGQPDYDKYTVHVYIVAG